MYSVEQDENEESSHSFSWLCVARCPSAAIAKAIVQQRNTQANVCSPSCDVVLLEVSKIQV